MGACEIPMAQSTTTTKAPQRALAGVIPVFQTPYHDDDSIDYATLEREIDWLFEHSADGIAMAMVSEVLRLSSEERRELATAACRFARGRGNVVISVGAESTKLAVDFARHAEECGADALMAIPPVTTGLDENEALRYFAAISNAVKIPLIVQDASGYVGRPLPFSLYTKLLAEFGDRIYFKPEATPIGPRLTALREASGGSARVFEGTGGMALVDSFRRGIVGTIPGADLIRGIVALWQALVAGDEARAYRLSLPISALVSLQTSLDAFLAVEKFLLVKQGVFSTARVRGPVGFHLDEETRREVDRLFDLVSAAIASG
jgi:4-hydroxy-tetrahydrodipicolinate synthase